MIDESSSIGNDTGFHTKYPNAGKIIITNGRGRINDDGSETGLKGNGSPYGNECLYGNGKKLSTESGSVWDYWVFIMVLSVVAFCFAIMYIVMKGKCNSAEDTIERLNYDIERLKEDVESQKRYREVAEDDLQTLKRYIGSTMPLIVSNIEIANVYYGGEVETDYGKTIYSHNTMYLKPKIDYYGILSGSATLFVRLITPYGYVSQGSSSPQGYT